MYACVTSAPPSALMKWANEKPTPKWAARIADWSLEPSSHTSGDVGPVGIASTCHERMLGRQIAVQEAERVGHLVDGNPSTPAAAPPGPARARAVS